jgi:predicted transcriptional regulator
MASNPLINEVLERMRQLDITQSELASACDLSQPHISKVLSGNVNLASKTEGKLSVWLQSAGDTTQATPNEIVRSLAARLERLRPAKRMQIMELLKAVERVIEA